jgi:hypothetical protein
MLYTQTHTPVLDINNHQMKKILHPKVIHVLSQLREPSPARVPRDETQPKSGDLKSMNLRTTVFETVLNASERTKDVSLSLHCNSLLQKRRVLNPILK